MLPQQFLQSIRQIISEEVNNVETQKLVPTSFETPGLTYKPLYKIAEVCALFHVSKPTIYDWVKHGKLKPSKSGQGFTSCGRISSNLFGRWKNNGD